MATDSLAILFDNAARVKLLRFFVFNPHKVETFDEVSKRARLVRRTARTEMSILEKAGVVKKKTFYIPVLEKEKKMKAVGYTLDKSFLHLNALQAFLFATAPINGKTLLRHLRSAGVVDFVAVAGVFMQEFEHRLDVMVTMKKLDENKIANAMRALEAELGIDIKFASMTTDDLLYRIGMHDKLIRDVFDYSHEILVDKAGIRSELGLF